MTLSNDDIDTLVLATVNAPYAKKLDQAALIMAIVGHGDVSRAVGPLSSFFYDVPIDLQKRFAIVHGVSEQALIDAARHFAAWSGKPWPGAVAA